MSWLQDLSMIREELKPKAREQAIQELSKETGRNIKEELEKKGDEKRKTETEKNISAKS